MTGLRRQGHREDGAAGHLPLHLPKHRPHILLVQHLRTQKQFIHAVSLVLIEDNAILLLGLFTRSDAGMRRVWRLCGFSQEEVRALCSTKHPECRRTA